MNAAQRKVLKGLGARRIVCGKPTKKEEAIIKQIRAEVERDGKRIERMLERSRKHPVRLTDPQNDEEYWDDIRIEIRRLMWEIQEREKEVMKLLRALEKPMPKRKGGKG